MIYSHPDKLLIEHLNNVYKLGKEIFARKKLNFDNQEEIENALSIILLAHDFGKATSYFQQKLKENSKNNVEANKQIEFDQELSKHSHISALLAYQFAEQILEDKTLVWIVFITVYRHHSNLKDLDIMLTFDDSDWPKLEKQFKALDFSELDKITSEISNFDFKPSSINFDNLKIIASIIYISITLYISFELYKIDTEIKLKENIILVKNSNLPKSEINVKCNPKMHQNAVQKCTT
jgi:CRISPR-associated endonuclease/helicase Cas3